MMKALIVDDEEKSRITLGNLVARHCPTVKVVELCDSVSSAMDAIQEHTPDVVFLDIEMPFENGFRLLEKIGEPSFEVIFTTAYDHYAIKAIKFSALDYILKPVEVEELQAAVAKLRRKKNAAAPDNLELLFANLKTAGKAAKIAVPTFDGLQMIKADEIVKCTADESYTHLSMSDGSKLTVSRILKEFEDLLSDLNFFRVHNSHLVNLIHVKKYVKGEGGYLMMSDGETVEVSRRRKNDLLQRLALLHL